MTQSNIQSDLQNLCDILSANPCLQCPKCGSDMMHLNTTFFTTGPDGQMWAVPLPVCPKCDLKVDTAKFVPTIDC
jgi:hypothetical protein